MNEQSAQKRVSETEATRIAKDMQNLAQGEVLESVSQDSKGRIAQGIKESVRTEKESLKSQVSEKDVNIDSDENLPKTKKGKKVSKTAQKPKEQKSSLTTKVAQGEKNEQKSPQLEQASAINAAKKNGEVIREPKSIVQDSQEAIADVEDMDFEEQILESEPKTAPKLSSQGKMQTKNARDSLLETLVATETGKVKELSKKDQKSKNQSGKNLKDAYKASEQKTEKSLSASSATLANALLGEEELEPQSFEEILRENKKEANTRGEKTQETKETKAQSNSSKASFQESVSTQNTQRTQILYRSHLARESVRNFAQSLKEEVLNYKPPITKLSMELNPQNLGALEVTISKKGKDLHIQVVSNSTAMGLFLQNQVDFKNNLNQMGFDNVDLSFTSSEGGNGGGSKDSSQQHTSANDSSSQEGNKNSLEDSQNERIDTMNIVLPKYA
ncbi:flagellar hook-length control protein FliK [Helicobacter sp. MIT 05-5293]|uniref:flagellar hook-length control protein FliK n=1 Tax=Helicobacter sp. MIT 05-5293 TaxID=1548149 RepID=UPI00068A957F|nr:flagellar hook-length control protein FliK [Helicobacter sp. MIT 05-5293]